VGDLKGIISKPDYNKSLGVDIVRLNPIFTSPNDDNGYDISDYHGIVKKYGTMRDFDELLNIYRRKIKLVLNLIANYTSNEHFWFPQAKSSRTNPYRNCYHW
jgi:oligo-1,6-glucosidase